MITVRRTDHFDKWLAAVKDNAGRARIAVAVGKLAYGLGDIASVGNGVSELRLHFGPGYRLYFVRREEELIILLCGGTKRRQSNDIVEAKRLADEIQEQKNGEQD